MELTTSIVVFIKQNHKIKGKVNQLLKQQSKKLCVQQRPSCNYACCEGNYFKMA